MLLVTGGMGYIGSHACLEFIKSGYEILILDNLSNSKLEVLLRLQILSGQKIPYIIGDIRDQKLLETLFTSYSIKGVAHFAGLKSIGESIACPEQYYENNVYGSLQLIQLMLKYKIPNFIFSSSAAVYGPPEALPSKEEHSTKPLTPYGWTKHFVERMLLDIEKAHSFFNPIILRYCNPIGAHESGMIGEDSQGIPNNLMPYLSQVAIGRRPFLQIFGDDYQTKDGTGERDYIHVVDLAKAHVKAYRYILGKNVQNANRKVGQLGLEPEPVLEADLKVDPIFNIGTGKPNTVYEVMKAFSKVSGKEIKYKVGSRRAGDLASHYSDPQRAQAILGWFSEFSLEKMCEDTWNWQVRNPNGYESKNKDILSDPL